MRVGRQPISDIVHFGQEYWQASALAMSPRTVATDLHAQCPLFEFFRHELSRLTYVQTKFVPMVEAFVGRDEHNC